MTAGAQLIADERMRQQSHEGYGAVEDDRKLPGVLVNAAFAYARLYGGLWPWSKESFRTSAKSREEETPERVRDLVKAGALIAAEIDRIHRKLEKSKGKEETSREKISAALEAMTAEVVKQIKFDCMVRMQGVEESLVRDIQKIMTAENLRQWIDNPELGKR